MYIFQGEKKKPNRTYPSAPDAFERRWNSNAVGRKGDPGTVGAPEDVGAAEGAGVAAADEVGVSPGFEAEKAMKSLRSSSCK